MVVASSSQRHSTASFCLFVICTAWRLDDRDSGGAMSDSGCFIHWCCQSIHIRSRPERKVEIKTAIQTIPSWTFKLLSWLRGLVVVWLTQVTKVTLLPLLSATWYQLLYWQSCTSRLTLDSPLVQKNKRLTTRAWMAACQLGTRQIRRLQLNRGSKESNSYLRERTKCRPSCHIS